MIDPAPPAIAMTPRQLHHAKGHDPGRIDMARQQAVEKRVSDYIQSSFSFITVPANEKEQRLRLEARLISTISFCETCRPSETWLGRFCPKEKIQKSGPWLVNELYRQPSSADEFDALHGLYA